MKKTCWILVEKGLKGTENQCVALAEAAGFSYDVKHISMRQPWEAFTPWIRAFSLTPDSSPLAPPWPDTLIASGRKAIAPALWIKKKSDGKTKLVVIQDPVIRDSAIDLIVAPKHDRVAGGNVLEITGALSIIKPDDLIHAKEQWRGTFEKLNKPRLAVLIGGNSRAHKMTEKSAQKLAAQLKDLSQTHSLMITASRRTPETEQKILRNILRGDNIFFWDGTGENPYRGILAWGDAVLVTEDSVSMACEAVSTGKPVYIIPMEGGSARFKRFHDYLYQSGYARPFEGRIEAFSYVPPNDLEQAKSFIIKLLNK
jgi:mitochondrial fission protein ELM1